MLTPRLFAARFLGFSLLLGSVAVAGIWGCQGPDTFLRSGIGAGGSPSGFGGFNVTGVGGHGTGGTTGMGGMGVGGGTGTGGRGMGGMVVGTGGNGTAGMTGTGGGTVGTGGARDGGTDVTGVGGAMMIDAGADREGGTVGGTGPCAAFCAPTTNVVDFVVSQGNDFHSGGIGLGEGCYQTTSAAVGGVVCSSFTANGGNRMLSVNGVVNPTCSFNNPARVNGGFCLQISPGVPDFAAIAVF
jgi:hypothetical protein